MGVNVLWYKIAYGSVFILIAPLFLWWWAHASAQTVSLPALHLPILGCACVFGGLLLVGLGMLGLWRHGKGLPMNAFPPPLLVQRGVYALVPHPIYVGFTAMCLGLSLWNGSASGLWLVTPCTALALWALVSGYERHDLERRFGSLPRPWLSLPPNTSSSVSLAQRFAVLLLVFVPWILLFGTVSALGQAPDAWTVFLPGESNCSVWVWTEWIYITAYLVPLIVLVPRDAKELRRFAVQGLLATGIVGLIFLCIPIISPLRAFDAKDLAGKLLQQEHSWFNPAVAAFPSFHVIWAFLAAEVLRRRFSRLGIFGYFWACTVVISCWTTGMHAALDICAGIVFAGIFVYTQRIWEWLRLGTQWIAASRCEWHFGPIRIINHGIYAGIGAGLGIWTIGCLTQEIQVWTLPIIGLCGLIGAALWAQIVEGSPLLLRPFGYYGSVFGSLAGLILCWGFGAQVLVLIGAFAAAAPLIQAWGRLRCLVQGCCHGHAAPAWLGIVYTHPQSRVLTLANLGGVPLHPTQLYSIFANLIMTAILLRLWFLGASPLMIAGLYLVLSSIARFVEEGFRGEPQTIRLGALPIYQWLAIVLSIFGSILTTIPMQAAPQPHWGTWQLALVALGFACVTCFAMGVDFPKSQWRFSRLT